MMRKLTIKGQLKTSTLLIGDRLQNAGSYIPGDRLIVVTDTNVGHLYQKQFPSGEVITIGTGESVKSLETVREIYHRLVDLKADRSTFILGIGGGVVCDICGFVASTYMRGLRVGYIPTTLLAQVDASVGGKNGVNLGGYKNLVGVFNQPEFVLCDGRLLKTLPQREVLCGAAEIIKQAAVADIDLFNYLEQNCDRVMSLDDEVIEKLIYDSVVIKSAIVNRDETERGERRKLNFGHTFGHAIEKCTAFNHGEAVAVGMVIAAALSVEKGVLSKPDALRLKEILEKFSLPTQANVSADEILNAIERDKKRAGDNLHFVFLKGLGDAIVEEVSLNELADAAGKFLLAGI
jgi:3-dehydroquinate synthase